MKSNGAWGVYRGENGGVMPGYEERSWRATTTPQTSTNTKPTDPPTPTKTQEPAT